MAAAMASTRSEVAVELAFLGHALESLAGALDAVLIVVAIGRKQSDDFIAAAGGGAPHTAAGKIDGLSDVELVSLQRQLSCTPIFRDFLAAGGRPRAAFCCAPFIAGRAPRRCKKL